MSGWGGRRENQTGRPKGSTKPEGVRTQRQLRAYDDEWAIIQRFARALKHGKREECERALEEVERIK